MLYIQNNCSIYKSERKAYFQQKISYFNFINYKTWDLYKNGRALAEDVDNFRDTVYLPGLGIYEQLINNGVIGNQKIYK